MFSISSKKHFDEQARISNVKSQVKAFQINVGESVPLEPCFLSRESRRKLVNNAKLLLPYNTRISQKIILFPSFHLSPHFSITFRSLALRQNITLVGSDTLININQPMTQKTCFFTFFASLLMHYAPETFKM